MTELITELQSQSAPRIRKVAESIARQGVSGYEDQLLEALSSLMLKPKSWQTQSQLIRAIGITGSTKAIPYMKELALLDFVSAILYRDLGFAICLLEDIHSGKLDYLKSTLSSGNELLMAGACSALLYSKSIPCDKDIIEIIKAISNMETNEGQIITPRCYVAAVAYLWPASLTKPFLELCTRSNWSGLVEIAKSSLHGKPSTFVLV